MRTGVSVRNEIDPSTADVKAPRESDRKNQPDRKINCVQTIPPTETRRDGSEKELSESIGRPPSLRIARNGAFRVESIRKAKSKVKRRSADARI